MLKSIIILLVLFSIIYDLITYFQSRLHLGFAQLEKETISNFTHFRIAILSRNWILKMMILKIMFLKSTV